MKSLLLAGMISAAFATACFAQASGYWVVGNRADGRCDIVTSNPVIIGDIWFGDGPYKSMADARLARSTIRVCPPVTPEEEKEEDGTD